MPFDLNDLEKPTREFKEILSWYNSVSPRVPKNGFFYSDFVFKKINMPTLFFGGFFYKNWTKH